MQTTILKGKTVSSKIKEGLIDRVKHLKSLDITPGLAAIIIGNNPASELYVSSKAKTFKKMNCFSEIFKLDKDIKQNEIIDFIKRLNKNDKFHGILLQLPLPVHLDENELLNTIDPIKDVDGFHPANLGLLMQGNPNFIPCTPLGCIKILDHYKIKTEKKHVVVVGRSNIVGKPIASLLSQNFNYGNATVTLCHSRTSNLSQFTKQADILIAAVGVPNLIKKNMVREGVVIIDVGINRIEDKDKERGYRIVGDVDFEGMLNHAEAITPVPGGVGVMTVTMLLSNTIDSAFNKIKKMEIK